jgi:hypothetical protein
LLGEGWRRTSVKPSGSPNSASHRVRSGWRLARLERELREEPERIRQSYEVRAHRLEPVGLVYLWPVSG